MASKGIQRVNATADIDKNLVVSTYKEIQKIITRNSTTPFKKVISEIAKINVGTFYNYIYRGNQQGQVSLYTVKNLADYFNLPEQVFSCEVPLTEDIKEAIAEKIRKHFGSSESLQQQIISPTVADNEITTQLKAVIHRLKNENNLEIIKQAMRLLDLAKEIAASRQDIINKISQI